MNKRPHLLTLACAAAVAGALLWPEPTQGADQPDATAAALIRDLQAQQKLALANQDKIDQQIAALAEELRLARIFASRGGKK